MRFCLITLVECPSAYTMLLLHPTHLQCALQGTIYISLLPTITHRMSSKLSVVCQLLAIVVVRLPPSPPPASCPFLHAPHTSPDGDIQLIDTQLNTIYWHSDTAANRTTSMWLCLDDYGPLGLEGGSRVYWRPNWNSSAGTPYRFYVQVSWRSGWDTAPCTEVEL